MKKHIYVINFNGGSGQNKMLHVINYFLERFLNESIPKMFKEDFFTEADYEKLKQYMRLITPDKGGKNKFDKHFLQR